MSLQLALLIVLPAIAPGGLFIVDSTSDDPAPGTTTLREAIGLAGGGDTIEFIVPNGSVITLTHGQLLINKNLSISGYGPDKLTVQRSALAADALVFSIASGNFDVTIFGLTIAGGRSDIGGGIANFNSGTLNVSSCTLTGNITLGGDGAGLSNANDGTVNVTDCAFYNNTAKFVNGNPHGFGKGGGIANRGSGLVNITNCTISGNSADGASSVGGGGGVANDDFFGTIIVSGSTIDHNSTHHVGGGIYSNGTLMINECTISDNTADTDGGGISAYNELDLNGSTIFGNSAMRGGGIFSGSPFANKPFYARGSLVAGNFAPTGRDVQGPLTSRGYNLIGNASGATITIEVSNTFGPDQIGTPASPIDPRLGPLQNNGGPTLTRALLFASPAIDKGGPLELVSIDQRGLPRPVDLDDTFYPNAQGGDGTDIGAFEAQSLPPSNCVQPPANLAAWWPFDGNGSDIQGGNFLTFTGNPAFVTGEVGQAVSLANPNTYAKASASSSLNVGSANGFTVDAWIKPTEADVSSQHPLLEWNTGDGFFGVHLWLSVTFSGSVGPGNLFGNIIDTVGVNHVISSVPNLIQANLWQHVALTYDKGSGIATLYWNGGAVAQKALGTFTPQTFEDLYIGFRPSGPAAGTRYTGAMDEAELFNRALTAAEIQSIYAAGSMGKCKPGQPTPTPTPTPTATPTQLLNISTRLNVLTGDNVGIGGFIVTGTDPKRVILRAIGPSLTSQGVPDALQDPTLELHDSTGATIAFNDNWKDTQQTEIEATTIPPTNDLESAIVAILPANNSGYTAILRGNNNTTGVGLVEAYDLDQAANSRLANISTRGFVDLGDNAMIGGFILGGGAGGPVSVIVRAIGPSLGSAGVSDPLQDPTLELHDGSGTMIAFDDNWKDSQQAEIQATGIPPADDRESAIIATLTPGNYTAVVRGVNDTTGVALVEAYNLQ
jgi:hypothetical protein